MLGKQHLTDLDCSISILFIQFLFIIKVKMNLSSPIHATKRNDLWKDVGCWNLKQLMIWMLPNERICTFIARSIYEINNHNERHICDAILILNEVSKKAHVRALRSHFDGSDSKWTNHTWASRMKFYYSVIKSHKSHSAWRKSLTWEWSIFVKMKTQWKTHSFFSDAHWG